MSWYLDASVLVPLHVAEFRTDAVAAALAQADSSFVVSELAAGEFASAISRRVRMDKLDPDTANAWISLFDDWNATDTIRLAVNNADIRRAAAIVRRFDLKLLMPDAIHVGLCVQHGFTLVTLDDRMADAAEMLGVAVVLPR